MFAGIPGDKIGRRDSLRAMAVLYLVSALGCAFAWNWFALVLFPIHRRARHWWLLRSWPDVYCGGCARQVARPSRGFVSVQHCLRNSARLFLKLHCGKRCSLGLLNGGGSWAFLRYRPSCFFCFSSASLAVRAGWSKSKEWPRRAMYSV